MLELKEICVLSAGIVGYPALCESTEPLAVASRLNALYESLTTMLYNHDGICDKFVDGGLVALFGAPVEIPDMCGSAAACALEMAEIDGLAIGVAHGRAAIGYIGSRTTQSYTAIGDVVNVAIGLRHAAQQLGACVYASAAVHSSSDDWIDVRIEGRNALVRAYRLA